jgi:hypothetical protein
MHFGGREISGSDSCSGGPPSTTAGASRAEGEGEAVTDPDLIELAMRVAQHVDIPATLPTSHSVAIGVWLFNLNYVWRGYS